MEEEYYENQLKNINDRFENLERQLDKGNKCVVIQMGSKVTKFGLASDSAPTVIETTIAYRTPKKQPTEEIPGDAAEEQKKADAKPFSFPRVEATDEIYSKIYSGKSLKVYEDKKTKLMIKEMDPDVRFLPSSTKMEQELPEEVLFEVGVAEASPGFTLFRPIYRGNFNTFDGYSEERAANDLVKLIEHILYQKLQIPIQSIEEYDLLFVLPDNFNRKQYENLFDLVFKSVNCGGICLQLESVMCAFANCLASGLFLDLGYTKTTIVAVDEGVPIEETLTVLDFGIQNIVQIYERILATKRNITASDFDPPSVWESILPALGRFNYDVDEDEADKIILRKAKLLLKMKEEDEPTEFMLNLDDTVVALNAMFLELPELKLGPLDQAIVDAVFKIQNDELRKKLLLNIMPSGGFAQVEGLTTEIENRVIEKVPDEIEEVAVMEPQSEEINQTHAPFIGGTIVPKLDSYPDVLARREVYMGATQTAEKRTVVGKNYLKERLSFKW